MYKEELVPLKVEINRMIDTANDETIMKLPGKCQEIYKKAYAVQDKIEIKKNRILNDPDMNINTTVDYEGMNSSLKKVRILKKEVVNIFEKSSKMIKFIYAQTQKSDELLNTHYEKMVGDPFG